MRKSQVYVLFVGFLLVGGFLLMPRVVVNSKNTALTESSATQEDEQQVENAHKALTQTQQQELDSLLAGYAQAKELLEKRKWLDALLFSYKMVNRYAEAADLAVRFSEQFAQTEHVELAANTCFEAYQALVFAVNASQTDQLLKKSRQLYNDILSKDPKRLDIKTQLGLTYMSSDNPMQGVQLIREVLEVQPDFQPAIFNLGLLSIQSGQFDKAVERFEQLLAINPEHVEALFYLGISYVEVGNKEKGLQQFEKVKQLSKDPAILGSIERFLNDH